MVVIEFLDCMEGELCRLFDGMVFENSSGGEAEMHIFKQDFPIRQFNADAKQEDDDFFPYCVVRAENGTSGNHQTVGIAITFGICERGADNNGELRILNLIERVTQRFLNDRTIGGKFRLSYEEPIRWGLPKDVENTYPYFYGLLEMTWESFYDETEDRYA